MSDSNRNDEGSGSGRPASRLWRYAPLIFWMAAIFFASTDELSGSNTALVIEPFLRWFFPRISIQGLEFIHGLVRKGAHLSAYAILGLLAARAFSTSRHSLLRLRWFLASLALISLYALSDEYHQSFAPSRTASIYDSMIDVAGGLTALVLIALWKRTRKTRRDRAATLDVHD